MFGHLCIHIFFIMWSTLWCSQHSWLQTVWIFFGRAQLVCQLLNATLKLPRFAPNFWVTHNCFLNILNVLRSSERLVLSCIVADICKKILTFFQHFSRSTRLTSFHTALNSDVSQNSVNRFAKEYFLSKCGFDRAVSNFITKQKMPYQAFLQFELKVRHFCNSSSKFRTSASRAQNSSCSLRGAPYLWLPGAAPYSGGK